MLDKILIKKSLIPYSFDIALPDEIYSLTVTYNSTADLFVVSLKKDDKTLCTGEPIMYGMPLFYDFIQREGFPYMYIIPYDESETYNKVTFDNFNDSVFLTVLYGA